MESPVTFCLNEVWLAELEKLYPGIEPSLAVKEIVINELDAFACGRSTLRDAKRALTKAA